MRKVYVRSIDGLVSRPWGGDAGRDVGWPRSAMALAAVPLMGLGGVAGGAVRGVHSTKSLVRVVVLGDSTAYTLAFSLGVLKLDDKYHDFLQDRGNIGCGLITGPEERIMGVPYYPKSDCNGSPATPGRDFRRAAAQGQVGFCAGAVPPQRRGVARRTLGDRRSGLQRCLDQHPRTELRRLCPATARGRLQHVHGDGSERRVPHGALLERAKPTRWPALAENTLRLAAYNALLQKLAAEYPRTDSVVDLNGLVCPKGVYTADYKGVTIREPDGIHFTDEAGIALAPALLPPILAAGRAALGRHHGKRTTRSSKP